MVREIRGMKKDERIKRTGKMGCLLNRKRRMERNEGCGMEKGEWVTGNGK